MVYVIELHSREEGRVIGSRVGTHEGKVTVHNEQALWQIILRAAAQRTWYRAYVIKDTFSVVCVIGRGDNDVLYRVGHVDGCKIGEGLPYMHPHPATGVASIQDGAQYWRVSARDDWVRTQFQSANVATTVLLQNGRVHYAWERKGAGYEMVANGRTNPSIVHKA